MPRTYRKKRDQKWTEEDMIKAIALVQSGETSQYKAANMFSIPKQIGVVADYCKANKKDH